MSEISVSLLSGLLGAFCGGGLSLLGTYITLKSQRKKDLELQRNQFVKEDERWLKEKRIQIFIDLCAALDAYCVPVILFDDGQMRIDKKELENYVFRLNEYINNHLGELFLFLNHERYIELYELRGKIFKLLDDKTATDEETYFKKCFKLTVDVKEIMFHLKGDLGIKEAK